MKALITGGLGFIGRACIPRLLERGCREIRVLDDLEPTVHGDRPNAAAYRSGWGDAVELVIGSVTDPKILDEQLSGVDTVLHLASLNSVPGSMSDSARYLEVNVGGTARLLDLLPRHPSVRQLTLVSSRAVYGEGPYRCRGDCGGGGRQSIDVVRSRVDLERGAWDPVCPRCKTLLIPQRTGPHVSTLPVSVYGVSKLAQEQLLRLSQPLHRARITTLRVQNAYGVGQNRAVPDVGVANILAEQAIRGETLNLFEDGGQVRDFVLIDDVARVCIAAALGELPGEGYATYDVGTGEGVTLRQLAETIFDVASLTPKISVSGDYRIGDVRHCVASTENLSDVYPWAPVSLKDGVAQLVASLQR